MRLSELPRQWLGVMIRKRTLTSKVDIMSLNTQKADSLSGIEYLSLAIQAASRLKTPNVIISVDMAKQMLAEIDTLRLGELAPSFGHRDPEYTPPPLDVTKLTPTEVSQRISFRSIHDDIEQRRIRCASR